MGLQSSSKISAIQKRENGPQVLFVEIGPLSWSIVDTLHLSSWPIHWSNRMLDAFPPHDIRPKSHVETSILPSNVSPVIWSSRTWRGSLGAHSRASSTEVIGWTAIRLDPQNVEWTHLGYEAIKHHHTISHHGNFANTKKMFWVFNE